MKCWATSVTELDGKIDITAQGDHTDYVNPMMYDSYEDKWSVLPYTSKHLRGKTFAVHQQYALCRENFRGLQT